MTRRLASALLATAILCSGGCILDELTQGSGPTPGGTVTVTLGAQSYSTMALAQATGEPFSIEGDTPYVTFSVTATSTAAGTPYTLLAADGDVASMGFAELTGNHLEVHANGQSCIATSGTLSLAVGSDGKLGGGFDVAGSAAGLDGGTSCTMSGTISEVPINR